MKRKIALAFVTIVAVLLVWYLFVKPNDYLVTFTATTFPGAINQSIKAWHKGKYAKMPIAQEGLFNLQQQLSFQDTLVTYDWKIVPLTDSTSKVKVRIKDLNNSLKNRILIPFTQTVLEIRSKKNILDFNGFLNRHLRKFNVEVVGKEQLKPTYCAYLRAKSTQAEKAFTMMRDFPYLSGFVKDSGIEPDGHPFLEITQWDRENDSIAFNFCYPIVKTDTLPNHKEIKYKGFEGRKALKAIYNGNYITSDRAWYKLLDHAKNKGIELYNTPIEVFYNNPSMGGNELEWKAEIYMLLKND